MNPYWRPIVQQLDPYVPGEQPKLENLLKLNTNESPYPPSPRALAAIQNAATEVLRRYPDPGSEDLRRVLARHLDVDTGNVFVGNGSDEVLAHSFRAFFGGSAPLLFPDITYSFYPVYCGLFEIDYQTVPLAGDFAIDWSGYARDNSGIIFANPNAPTGIAISRDEIESLLQQQKNSVVVVDEAYVDFGAESAVPLISRYPNLLVIQTFSKSWALAGLRVGYAIGDAGLIEALERVKNSFNSYPLNRPALAGAFAAVEDAEYMFGVCRKVMQARDALSQDLTGLGFEVLPSKTNFVFARFPGLDGGTIAAKLREEGIIVRHFNKPRISEYLRITVGTTAECKRLVKALRGMINT